MDEWLLAFYKILIWPRPATFEEITGEVKGQFQSGIVWLVITALFASVMPVFGGGRLDFTAMFFLMIALPIGVGLWAGIIHYLYRRLSGQARNVYTELFYAIVCIVVPTTLVKTVLALVPVINNVINWAVPIYQIVLVVVAVVAITKLKVWQAMLFVTAGVILTGFAILTLPILMQSVRRTF